MASKLARLCPYEPRLGFVLKSYSILDGQDEAGRPMPMKFLHTRGWHRVTSEVAAKLEKVPQQVRYPYGPRAFMIAASKEEARRLDDEMTARLAESREEVAVGTPEEPVEMTAPTPAARPGTRAKTRTRTRRSRSMEAASD